MMELKYCADAVRGVLRGNQGVDDSRRSSCWRGDGVKLFGSSSARGTRLGLKQSFDGSVFLDVQISCSSLLFRWHFCGHSRAMVGEQ